MKNEKNTKLLKQVLELIGNTHSSVCNVFPGSKLNFSSLLENYVHFDFSEEEAENHWKNIIERYQKLKEKLGNEANAHLAIVDYFTNFSKQTLDQPMLIEVHVFRQTEQAAMIDSLTGLFNRRYMDIILKKEFNRCTRYDKNLSICIIDIDDFKKVNDTFGHQFGDDVLQELANALKNVLREEDIVCRYGGEEFLLILPETDNNGAFILCERIRKNISTIYPFKEKKITFSAGIASFPACVGDPQTLIRCADRALYEAKLSGKNKTAYAPEERRKFNRFPQEWKLDMYVKNPRNLITGIKTKNVSFGGLHFECNENYPVDTNLFLHFINPADSNKIIEVKARITWAKKLGEIKFNYGVTFINLPEVLKEAFSTEI
ncbi:MAG: GGDEF domain-containing protein [Treponema sp.]|nr:GGDEF domain-containing protein [Treponema sp.]